MKCGASSARQESSSLTERCPNAVSHAACQPAPASAQRITAWPTQKSLSGGRCRITRIEDSEPPVLAEVRLDLRAGRSTCGETHLRPDHIRRLLMEPAPAWAYTAHGTSSSGCSAGMEPATSPSSKRTRARRSSSPCKAAVSQLALPLPDPNAPPFTHTPSGRPRTVTAQERAYEQALREHWRALLLAVRGKLQSVESGISTFEDEFAGFLVPHFQDEKTARRKRPKAVNWLLGSSHSLAIALVAAFLVPASAVGAFALPPNVVDRLAAPFRGALSNELAVPSEDARAVALGQSSWIRY